MKKQILASLILASLSTSTFALPGAEQPPLIERQVTQHDSHVAAASAEHLRTLESEHAQRFHVDQEDLDNLNADTKVANSTSKRHAS